MAFSDDFALTYDGAFQERVRMAVLKSAAAILGGAASGAGAAVDAKREGLAKAAILGGAVNGIDMTPDTVYARFLWTVAAQSPTNDDTNVENAVSTVWNDVAGVDTTDSV